MNEYSKREGRRLGYYHTVSFCLYPYASKIVFHSLSCYIARVNISKDARDIKRNTALYKRHGCRCVFVPPLFSLYLGLRFDAPFGVASRQNY